MALVKYNNNSISSITTAGTLSASNILIKEQTASSSSSISFVHGSSGVVLDNTYAIYKFVYTSIHPSSDGSQFQVGFRDGGSNYDATKTSSMFATYHQEDDGESSGDRLNVASGRLAQSTSYQNLVQSVGADNDQNLSGEIILFAPYDTTFVKHYLARTSTMHDSNAIQDYYVGGYCNVTASIDAVQFKQSSGTFDGTIKMYGIKDS
tara:strand:- start:895 stop:1515 length:621 start_codon:yes stop_codon:yes gene_type:complete